jgi:recombination protein RecR
LRSFPQRRAAYGGVNRLPGVGFKSAQRMAFHVLSLSDSEAEAFAEAILEAKRTVKCCSRCRTLPIWRSALFARIPVGTEM